MIIGGTLLPLRQGLPVMDNTKVSFLDEISKQSAFQRSLALDIPYEYKGVMFYPVSLDRIIEFYTCVDILMIRQERTKDKKLMKLPYLWFLCYAFENWEQYQRADFGVYVPMLYALLELVTRSNDIEIKVEHKENGDFRKCILILNGVEFNYKEFIEIRRIIFAQAGIEHSDDFINADTEKAIYEGREYELKKSGYVPPTLENLIDILAMYLHKSVNEMAKNFSIRKFNNIIKYMSKFEEYKLLKSGEYSGMVTFKEKIPHWISGHEKEDILKGQNTDYRNSDLMKV